MCSSLALKAELMKQAAMGTDAPGGEQQTGEARSRSAGGGEPVEEVRKLRLQKERLEGLCRVLQGQIKAQKQQSQLDLDPVLQGQQQSSAAVASMEEDDEGDVRLPPPPQQLQQQQDTEAVPLEFCSGGESGV